jgi:flagellar biosynthesis regulator FlbT
MGFNKRMIDKNHILSAVNNNTPLKKLFNADSIIFLDDYSTEVYNLFTQGMDEKDIFKTLENKK